MTVSSFWVGASTEIKIKTRMRGSTWSGRGGSGFGLVPGGPPEFWEQYISDSGVSPSLVLDYSSVVGGQFFDGDDSTLSFADIHTFTRASITTQKDLAGKIKFVPHNFLHQSNDLDTSSGGGWTRLNMDAPVKSVTGPDGLTSGWVLQDAGGGGTDSVRINTGTFNVANSSTYRVEIYAKKDPASSNITRLAIYPLNFTAPGNGQTWFNLVTGSVETTFVDHTATMTDVGDGWFLCSLEFTTHATDTQGNVRFYICDGDNDLIVDLDDGSSMFMAFGAFYQTPMAAANDTFADTYVPTTTVPVYQHRLDHDISGNRIGLMLEEDRTNIALWSNDWTNAAYDTVTDLTPLKDETGADGVANSASSLLATANNGLITQSITSSSATRVLSVHIKRLVGTGNILVTQDDFSTTVDVKALINSSTFTQVGTIAATVTNPVVGIKIVTDTDKIAVQFGQSEVGGEFTSPIPTTKVAVTRAAEICDVATSDFSYNNEGANTVYVKASVVSLTGSLAPMQLHAGSTNEHVLFRVTGGATMELTVRDGSTTLVDIKLGTAVPGTVHKMSAAFALNNTNFSFDGSSGTNDTAVTMPSVNTLSIGHRGSANDRQINGHVAELAVYGARISDADNNALTT